MSEKFKSDSLLSIESIKNVIGAERLLEISDDTLVVRFVTGREIVRRERFVTELHDVRETTGWELARQFGQIKELLVVTRIVATTLESVNLRKYPFFQSGYQRAVVLSGRNADRTCFADARQRTNWYTGSNQIWEAPLISIATKQSRISLASTLEDIYRGAQSA